MNKLFNWLKANEPPPAEDDTQQDYNADTEPVVIPPPRYVPMIRSNPYRIAYAIEVGSREYYRLLSKGYREVQM